MQTTGRIPELDGLRGTAIALVVFEHFVVGEIVPGTSRAGDLLKNTLTLSWSGVDLFFVLSGFLIARILIDNWDSKNYFKSFYIRRGCRILPLYFLCLAFYLFFQWQLSPDQTKPFFTELLNTGIPFWTYPTFTQNFAVAATHRHISAWLGPTWSLVLEEQFYLVLPLLVWLVRPDRLLPFLAGLICLNPLGHCFLWMFFPQLFGFMDMALPVRANALLVGASCAYLFQNGRFRLWLATHRGHMLALLGLFLLGMAYMTPRYNLPGFELERILFFDTWFGLFYGCLLLTVLGGKGGVASTIIRFPALRELGIVAYGIYLFHQAINGLLHGLVLGADCRLNGLPDLLITVAALFVSVLFAAASWHWLEKPVIAWGRTFRYIKIENGLQHEALPSHCGDVAEPGDRRGQQNPVASAGGFQVVQGHHHRARHRDGTQDV